VVGGFALSFLGNETPTWQSFIENGEMAFVTSAWSSRKLSLNPLTPVPPVTARDEPWPFFHF